MPLPIENLRKLLDQHDRYVALADQERDTARRHLADALEVIDILRMRADQLEETETEMMEVMNTALITPAYLQNIADIERTAQGSLTDLGGHL